MSNRYIPEQYILIDQRLAFNRMYRQLGKQCWIDIVKMLQSDESLDSFLFDLFDTN